MMFYPYWLAGISVLTMCFERIWPAYTQPSIPKKWFWDGLHLLLNGHFFGVALYLLYSQSILPSIQQWGLEDTLFRSTCTHLSLWIQIPIAVLVIDFIQWCIHNLLHRIPALWNIHKLHHSVQSDEMSWIVAFRFSWMESIVYKSIAFVPLAWLGFSTEAIFVHAVFGTLIGHLNHANLSWDYGSLRFFINSPRMHRHHHDYDDQMKNFGIIFSCWDWIFQTAHLPATSPKKLGFSGDEAMPSNTMAQLIWPLPAVFPHVHTSKWTGFGTLFLLSIFVYIYL